jgi:hypothetical protein
MITAQIVPIIVFAVLSITVSFFVHKKFNSLLAGSLSSSVIVVVVYQIIGFVILGYLDPFFLIASQRIFVIAFIASMLVGLIIKKSAKKGQKGAEDSTRLPR